VGILKVFFIGKYSQSGNPSLTSNRPVLWGFFAFVISSTFLLKFDMITKCYNTIFMLLSGHSPKISQECSHFLHGKLHLSPTGTLPFGGYSSITVRRGWLHNTSVQNA